jgi:phosphohistidine phosphatase SixA
MRIVFIRHGERRRGESDPALTSAGRRMARETALWLQDQGVRPAWLISTPTTRTRETAEELALVFPDAARAERPESPEVSVDWEQLTEQLADDPGLDAPVVLVGHHPTVELLLDLVGPPPVPVPIRNFCSALVLDRAATGWTIAAAWPGRAA